MKTIIPLPTGLSNSDLVPAMVAEDAEKAWALLEAGDVDAYLRMAEAGLVRYIPRAAMSGSNEKALAAFEAAEPVTEPKTIADVVRAHWDAYDAKHARPSYDAAKPDRAKTMGEVATQVWAAYRAKHAGARQ